MRRPRVPTWARLTLLVVCVLELALVGIGRTVSGLAHLRAVQGVSDFSPDIASAACSEAVSALDDFWPFVPMLGVGRVLPFASARAWGQLPLLADVGREACPPIKFYASIAPWPDRSIQDGILASLLADVRREQPRLATANAQLADAVGRLQSVDVDVLSADPRLARVGRLLTSARANTADVSDLLSVMTPSRLEPLFGARDQRSIVLAVADPNPTGQAYVILDQGRVVKVDVGQPVAPPSAIIQVDHAGLASLLSTLPHAQVPAAAPDSEVARAVLAEFIRRPYSDEQNVVAVLRHAADDHHAWLWFDDPGLQSVIARRGWVRP